MSPACARPISIDGRPRQCLRAPSRRVSSAPLPRWPWVERPTRLALQARRVRPPRQVPLCADLPALLSCAQPPHDGPLPRAVPQPQQPPLGFCWPVLPVRASPAQHSQSCPAALPRPSVACDRSCARSCPQCPMAAGGPGPKPRSLPRGPRLIRPPWIEVVRRSTRRAIPIAGATGEAASCVPADMSARSAQAPCGRTSTLTATTTLPPVLGVTAPVAAHNCASWPRRKALVRHSDATSPPSRRLAARTASAGQSRSHSVTLRRQLSVPSTAERQDEARGTKPSTARCGEAAHLQCCKPGTHFVRSLRTVCGAGRPRQPSAPHPLR
jgi:hypothetical protein